MLTELTSEPNAYISIATEGPVGGDRCSKWKRFARRRRLAELTNDRSNMGNMGRREGGHRLVLGLIANTLDYRDAF